MTGPITTAVAGCGFGASVHIPALRLDERFDIRAVWSRTIEHAEQTARDGNIPVASSDWKAIIADDSIRAVTVAVPPVMQPALVMAALDAGKHVFCEKPLAVSLHDSRRMVDRAAGTACANMVDFEFSSHPAWIVAKRLVDDGVIGDIRHVLLVWNRETYAHKTGAKFWKTDPERGGGALNSFVSHCTHYLEWLAGPIRRVRTSVSNLDNNLPDCDTLFRGEFDYSSGAAGFASVSTASPGTAEHRLVISGAKGSLCLDNRTKDYLDGFTLTTTDRDGVVREWANDYTADNQRTVADGRITAVHALAVRFGNWIETGTPERPSFADGFRSMELLDAFRRSDASGNWIEV